MHIEYAVTGGACQRARSVRPVEVLRFILRNGKRVAILVIGLAFVVLGVVFLVLPGPGILGIIIGLAILATEFVWARVLLDKAKEQAQKAKDKVRRKKA